jgi:hypothetical protein
MEHDRGREKRNAYTLLVGKSEEKTPQGRTKRRWMDDIKMEIEWGGMDGTDLAQDRDYRLL